MFGRKGGDISGDGGVAVSAAAIREAAALQLPNHISNGCRKDASKITRPACSGPEKHLHAASPQIPPATHKE